MTWVYCQYMERGQVFQFRVSAGEKARIVELASAAGVSPSVWVRARALEQALGEPHRAPSTEGIGTSGENPAAGGVPGASGKPAPTPARASEPPKKQRLEAARALVGGETPTPPKIARRHWA